MTKKTRAQRQQAARRRPQPRPGMPGGAGPSRPIGGPGGPPTQAPAPVEPAADLDAGTDDEEEAVPAAAAAPAAPAARPGGPAARRVGRLDPAQAAAVRRGKAQQKQQQTFAPLDPEDPGIPFDRVPYVPADLRRVAIMAGFMVVLILIAAVVVTHTVG